MEGAGPIIVQVQVQYMQYKRTNFGREIQNSTVDTKSRRIPDEWVVAAAAGPSELYSEYCIIYSRYNDLRAMSSTILYS